MSEKELAKDGKPGCPVTVWDGPYSMRCSLGAAVGICAYHGEFAAAPTPDPAPTTAAGGVADVTTGGK